MTFVINQKTAMDILDITKKQNMRIYILKNYIKDLQVLLDNNNIDYSELRKKYLFQYSFTNNEISTEEQKKNLAYLRRVSRSNTL